MLDKNNRYLAYSLYLYTDDDDDDTSKAFQFSQREGQIVATFFAQRGSEEGGAQISRNKRLAVAAASGELLRTESFRLSIRKLFQKTATFFRIGLPVIRDS